jgi:uncharacterized protein (TIGR02145 family)
MKKFLLLPLAALLLNACVKKTSSGNNAESGDSESATDRNSKVTICHKTNATSNTWTTLEISSMAVAVHLAHGDILPDADGDGYTKRNPCGVGSQDDCNDTDRSVNPGATEICGNSKDDNCNGQTDENCYETVTICGKEWMVRNLDVSTFRNGDPIPQAASLQDWGLGGNKWAYVSYDPATGPVYGKLYGGSVVLDPRGLAPAGWHIPTDEEWTALADCLGGYLVAGGKMKETGTAHWATPNVGATNSSGFTGLANGFYGNTGILTGFGFNGFYWTGTAVNDGSAYMWARHLNSSNTELTRFSYSKSFGMAVRCVKD